MDPKHKGRTYVMELPEVGSKWVAKVDNPRGVDRIKKGDVVEVTRADRDLVDYTGGWCCVTTEWLNNFEPYQEKNRKFSIGDKVKCLNPRVVNSQFKGEVGVVKNASHLCYEGQLLTISYEGGFTQAAYSDMDGVVLVEPAQTKKAPAELTAEGYTPKDIKEPSGKIASDGGSSAYYDFPEGCNTLNDLIEYKGMSFAQGNIFKAAYRLGNKEGITLEYDLKKIKYYADRMLAQIGETK